MGEVRDRQLHLEAVLTEHPLAGHGGRVVHQGRNRRIQLQDRMGAGTHRVERREVGCDEVVTSVAGKPGQGVERLPAASFVPAYQDDAVTLAGETAGGGVADTAVGARDYDGLHVTFSFQRVTGIPPPPFAEPDRPPVDLRDDA